MEDGEIVVAMELANSIVESQTAQKSWEIVIYSWKCRLMIFLSLYNEPKIHIRQYLAATNKIMMPVSNKKVSIHSAKVIGSAKRVE